MRDAKLHTDQKHELLRVASPSTGNTQHPPHLDATSRATTAQLVSLKALARMALERTNPRNKRATTASKTAQQTGISDPQFVALEIVGSDDQTALQNFVDLVRITGACEHGVLLHRHDIEAQLDTKDHAALLETDRRDRQVWAELLAYRLTRSRTSS